MTINAQGVDFVSLPVTDFDRAVAFYRDVLGLEQSIQYGDLPGMEFEAGNFTISLMNFEAFGGKNASGTGAIVFKVDDVAATKEALEAKGVKFQSDIIESGVCHQAYFLDSEGNSLGLHHRYKPRD
jgi:predicted enzyme related to lactoylglutathione lyase